MNEILEEIISECNFRERIVIRTFKKVFSKVYHLTRAEIINDLLK